MPVMPVTTQTGIVADFNIHLEAIRRMLGEAGASVFIKLQTEEDQRHRGRKRKREGAKGHGDKLTWKIKSLTKR